MITVKAEIKIVYSGHQKFLSLETMEKSLYGSDIKQVFGLADNWEAQHHITEDNGLRIWQFVWSE